jgi:hypothetical protein
MATWSSSRHSRPARFVGEGGRIILDQEFTMARLHHSPAIARTLLDMEKLLFGLGNPQLPRSAIESA